MNRATLRRVWASRAYLGAAARPVLLLLALLPLGALGERRPPLLFEGGARLEVEVASRAAERQQGLMGRTELAADAGMLFVFPERQRQCLWMKNTLLPLSAAFLDEAGRVINLVDLHPHDLTVRCSSRPARYAVEANQGWFRRHGVVPGSRVEGLPLDGAPSDIFTGDAAEP